LLNAAVTVLSQPQGGHCVPQMDWPHVDASHTWVQHGPQSAGQLEQVSPLSQTPLPHVGHEPQSAGQLEHVSIATQMPLPQYSSNWHTDEQPSPLLMFPSSHSSPTSMTPLPHTLVTSFLHSDEHPSPSRLFPSSHSSPTSMTPLPQKPSLLQSTVHPSPPTLFPSSHSST
jgi:hypothetical protein